MRGAAILRVASRSIDSSRAGPEPWQCRAVQLQMEGRQQPMRVADIMARTIEFIAPDASVQAAATLMGEIDVGALPVGTADDLQGILTDRDILFRVVAAGRDSARVRVREVMSSLIYSCGPDDTIEAAMDMMSSYHVRRLPVQDEAGAVVGWVTLSDIARRLLLDTDTVRTALGELSEGGAPSQPERSDSAVQSGD
jgi:CBS domain-containing protein